MEWSGVWKPVSGIALLAGDTGSAAGSDDDGTGHVRHWKPARGGCLLPFTIFLVSGVALLASCVIRFAPFGQETLEDERPSRSESVSMDGRHVAILETFVARDHILFPASFCDVFTWTEDG